MLGRHAYASTPLAAFFLGCTMFETEAPDYLILADLLKATPAEEGGQRFVYLEASNEALDQQGEVVLARALKESADYYLRYGNVDLEHYTQLGAKAGIKDYHLYEIGRPVEVRVNEPRTFVKAQLFQGEGAVAEKANHVWESLTSVSPPQRWYPSVGGAVLEKGAEIDPETRAKKAVVRRVRWTNVGLSKTPVNQTVPTVAALPFGAFAKCFCPGTGCWDIGKAMEAGYGTDVAALTGGGALRRQSLDKKPQATLPGYWDFRERLSGDLLARRIKNGTAAGLVAHAVAHYGVDEDTAAEWTERWMRDALRTRPRLTTHLKQRRSQ